MSDSAFILSSSGFLPVMATLLIGMQRLGLGWMIDWLPFIILTTRDRRTGAQRYDVLEWRRHGTRYYIVSVSGTRSEWYQNLIQASSVTIQHGSRKFQARAMPVQSRDETARAVYMFRKNSPVYEILLTRISSAATIDFHTLTEHSHEFTVVRLEPVSDAPDMAGIIGLPSWAVPGGLLLILLIRMIFRRGRAS